MGSLATSEFAEYLRQVRRFPVLSPEEEQRLAVRYYETGDREAQRLLVLANLRFALKVALEYRHYAPLMDLVQEANLGLIEAVRRFNPYRGYRLITYAVWWIRAYIQRYILENSSIVRRGTTREQRKVLRRLAPARQALEQAKGGEATSAELADALDVSEAAVLVATARDVSLDAPLQGDEGEGGALLDFLAAQRGDPEAELIAHEERALLARALDLLTAELNEREKAILQARILASQPETLQTLAERFGISRERVRQIERRLRERLAAAVTEAGRRPVLAPAPPPRALPAADASAAAAPLAPLPGSVVSEVERGTPSTGDRAETASDAGRQSSVESGD